MAKTALFEKKSSRMYMHSHLMLETELMKTLVIINGILNYFKYSVLKFRPKLTKVG